MAGFLALKTSWSVPDRLVSRRSTSKDPLGPRVVDVPLAETVPLCLIFHDQVCPLRLLSISPSNSRRPSSVLALTFQSVLPEQEPSRITSSSSCPPANAGAAVSSEAATRAETSVPAMVWVRRFMVGSSVGYVRPASVAPGPDRHRTLVLVPHRSRPASWSAACTRVRWLKRLGEVAGHPVVGHVVLLREQPDVVGDPAQPVEELLGVVAPAGHGVDPDQPEGAGQERVLVPRQPVDAGLGAVARAGSRRPSGPARRPRWCRATSGSSPGRKPTSGTISREASTSGRVVVLDERAALPVDAVLQDLGPDLVADPPPAVEGPVEAVLLDRLDRAVERRPDHHPGVGEVLLLAADLPQPVVGLVPVGGEVVDEGALQRPARCGSR